MTSYSVIIPCHNSEKTLYSCLSSIKNATSQFDSEIIVVLSNSIDRSEKIAKEFNVKITYDSKKSAASARNSGAKIAMKKWLIFIDSDVEIDRDWLINAHKTVSLDIFKCFASSIKPTGQSSFLNDFRLLKAKACTHNTFSYLGPSSLNFPIINTAACIYEKAFFMRVGGFDSELKAHEDTDLAVRSLNLGAHIFQLQNSDSKVYWSDGVINYIIRNYKHGKAAKKFHSKWHSSGSIFSHSIFPKPEYKLQHKLFHLLINLAYYVGYKSSCQYGHLEKQNISPKHSHLNFIFPQIRINDETYFLKSQVRIIKKLSCYYFFKVTEKKYFTVPESNIRLEKGNIRILNSDKNELSPLMNFLQP